MVIVILFIFIKTTKLQKYFIPKGQHSCNYLGKRVFRKEYTFIIDNEIVSPSDSINNDLLMFCILLFLRHY